MFDPTLEGAAQIEAMERKLGADKTGCQGCMNYIEAWGVEYCNFPRKRLTPSKEQFDTCVLLGTYRRARND